eukprot:jgi/Ulvmu1/5786/UM025_0040.1
MSHSKIAKLVKALMPRPATPCVYDAGLDDPVDPSECLQEEHHYGSIGDGVGILRAHELPDGTVLLRSHMQSAEPGHGKSSAPADPLTLGDIMHYSHACVTPSCGGRASETSHRPHRDAELTLGLARVASIANSERSRLSSSASSAILGSTELPGVFYRSGSGRHSAGL